MLAATMLSGILVYGVMADSAKLRPHTGMTCQTVTSVVTAEAAGITPVLKGLRIRATGTSAGDLPGRVSLDIVKPYIGRELDVSFRVQSPRGEFVAQGKATTRRDGTSADSHSINSGATVKNGKGAFADSRGDINAIGHVDTHTRALELTITGVVCAEWPTAGRA